MKKFLGIDKKSKTKLSKQEQVNHDLLDAICAKEPSIKAVQSLIHKNANVNMELNGGNSLLHMMVSKNQLKITNLLIANKANINAQNNSGDTPAYTALKWGGNDTIWSLLACDINPKIANQYGNTLLQVALLKNDIGLLDILIQKGCDINHKNKNGANALHMALTNCQWDLAQFLIDHGADVNAKSLYNNTPLHIIIEYGDLNIIKSLIEHGVDVNAQNAHGDTALHIKIKTLNSFLSGKSMVHNQDFANFLEFLGCFRDTDLNLNIKNQNNQTVLGFLGCEYQKLSNVVAKQTVVELVDCELLSQFKEDITFFAKKAASLGEDITEYEKLMPELFLDIVSENRTKSALKVAVSCDVSNSSSQKEVANFEEQSIVQNLGFAVETPMIPDNTSDLSGASDDL